MGFCFSSQYALGLSKKHPEPLNFIRENKNDTFHGVVFPLALPWAKYVRNFDIFFFFLR